MQWGTGKSSPESKCHKMGSDSETFYKHIEISRSGERQMTFDTVSNIFCNIWTCIVIEWVMHGTNVTLHLHVHSTKFYVKLAGKFYLH